MEVDRTEPVVGALTPLYVKTLVQAALPTS